MPGNETGTDIYPDSSTDIDALADLSPETFRPVFEMRYPTLDKSDTRRPFYRVIMRFLYAQAQIPRDWSTVWEIREHVATRLRQREYTDEECERDLAYLKENRNVIDQARSLEGRPYTLEEFNRGRMVYQITQTSMEIERLLLSLEQKATTRASIDQSLLQSLWVQLENLRAAMEERPKNPEQNFILNRVHRSWDDAFTSFIKLRNNAVDFHNALHQIRPEQIEDLRAFANYKELLIHNLQGFINDLLLYAPRIRGVVEEIERAGKLDPMVADLTTARTRYIASAAPPDPARTRAEVAQQINSLRSWFQPGGSVDLLRSATQDSVRVILNLMTRLVARHRVRMSRQRDLETIARRFQQCATAEDAHRVASRSLGWANPRHMQGVPPPPGSEQEALPPWAAQPRMEFLQARSRGPKARGETAPVRDVAAEQARIIAEEQLRRRALAAQWDALFEDGEIKIGDLNVEDEQVASELLRVLGQCLASPTHTAPAPDGRILKLVTPFDPDDIGALRTPRGMLLTPRFRLTMIAS